MAKDPSPLLGYNNNIRHKNRVFHIQTEDSGVRHPHIITHLFMDGGRILKSVKTSYAEHLGVEKMADLVRKMMKDQHKGMLIALRDGQFDPVIDGGEAPKAKAPAPTPSLQALEAAAPSRAVESGTPGGSRGAGCAGGARRRGGAGCRRRHGRGSAAVDTPSISPSVSRPARPPSIPDRVEITELERAVAAAPERVFEPGPSDLRPPRPTCSVPAPAGTTAPSPRLRPSRAGEPEDIASLLHGRRPRALPRSSLPLPAGAARASGSGSARAGSPSGAPPRAAPIRRTSSAPPPAAPGGSEPTSRTARRPVAAPVVTTKPAEPRYASARPAAIFGQAKPRGGSSIFGEDIISDKSLDEVIMSYLAEDMGAKPDPKRRK